MDPSQARYGADVRAAQSGDARAFARLVQHFQDMAFAVALGRLGDAPAAEEAAQEAFVEAFLHLESLDDPLAFPGWFRTIVERQCHRDLRSRKAVGDGQPPHVDALTETDRGPEHDTESRQLMDLLLQTIDHIPAGERSVILMHYVGDYSQSEIADFLELPLTTVKKRLHDAKIRLRELMTERVRLEARRLRPSSSDRFREIVELSVACITGDLSGARRLLDRSPRLVHSYGEVSDVGMRKISAHWGWTPLHLAAHYGHLEIVKLLLSSGADLEAKALNSVGNTALGAAVWGDRLDVVQYLVERGADMNALNHFGQAALHRAVRRGATRIVEFLISAGADVQLRNAEGLTAAQLAETTDDPDMIRAFQPRSTDKSQP